MVLPPIRIHRAGEPIDDVIRLSSANTRAPYVVLGDISGQIGVTRIGRKHIQEMCARFGADTVLEAMEAMVTASGKEFRSALKNIPDGFTEATGYLDHDGVDETKKVKLNVKISSQSGKLHFDFTGCDPQTQGPVNLRIAMVEACVYYCLIGLIDPDLRYSDGIRELVTFEFAKRSVLSAEPPRPCSSYMKCCLKLCDVILEAMDPLLPGRAIAHSGGRGGSIIVSWIIYDLICKSKLINYKIIFPTLLLVIGTAISFGLTKIYGPRFAFLQSGIILGSIMTMNVFFVIAPNGKKIASAALKKEKFDLNFSLRAKVRSVHNNIITLLVLFIMLSGHASFISVSKYNWLILTLLAVTFGLIQYYINWKNKKEIN